jgi:hypothetical protein
MIIASSEIALDFGAIYITKALSLLDTDTIQKYAFLGCISGDLIGGLVYWFFESTFLGKELS